MAPAKKSTPRKKRASSKKKKKSGKKDFGKLKSLSSFQWSEEPIDVYAGFATSFGYTCLCVPGTSFCTGTCHTAGIIC